MMKVNGIPTLLTDDYLVFQFTLSSSSILSPAPLRENSKLGSQTYAVKV